MDYKIDMAICIDPSGKVGEHIDDIKSYAVCFLDKILTSAEESGHNISALRVKFIQVSSPESGERSITETDFYSFTNGEEKEKISEVLDSVKPNGGVTKYDNFYELLKCAFNSDWTDADGARHVTAIIVAGGNGSRMGSTTTKQMMELDGIPVVVRTILAFTTCPRTSSGAADTPHSNTYGSSIITLSISNGPIRYPEDLITSSTRPTYQ